MRAPVVKWRALRSPAIYDAETWFARYRGWTLYLHQRGGRWHASVHRFRDGTADMADGHARYATREGAENAATYYAEEGRWPHTQEIPT